MADNPAHSRSPPVAPVAKRKGRASSTPSKPSQSLTVAVTGPTGEMGQAVVAALERSREVGRILGMARRPFDPREGRERGWKKFDYRQGDVLDRKAVKELVQDADVVVHLAFLIMGSPKETADVNLKGSKNVFGATVAAKAKRLVYASSVAAYGFDGKSPQPLTEEVQAKGTASHYYSAQKAAVEKQLAKTLEGSSTKAYVFRPSIVGGPQAPLLIDSLPYTQISERLPSQVLRLLDNVPILKPVLPDPGVPFQLVHHDDVATAMRGAVLGKGKPGVYNLAGEGQLTVAQLAEELGWYSIPIPEPTVDVVASMIERLEFLPSQAQWIAAFKKPMIMDVTKAKKELRWRPKYTALETLRETITAARMTRFVR